MMTGDQILAYRELVVSDIERHEDIVSRLKGKLDAIDHIFGPVR